MYISRVVITRAERERLRICELLRSVNPVNLSTVRDRRPRERWIHPPCFGTPVVSIRPQV